MTALADRLKRLRLRAWRRGTKEMDLILGSFVDDCAASLGPAGLDRLESLMEENDLDIYAWITGQAMPPPAHRGLIARISRHSAHT